MKPTCLYTCCLPVQIQGLWGSKVVALAHLAGINSLHLGIVNITNLRFQKVCFRFLFHYGCTVLKPMNVFKIYEDGCINNFEDVGLSGFVFLIPICNRVQGHGLTSLTLVRQGTCSPVGYMNAKGLFMRVCGSRSLEEEHKWEKWMSFVIRMKWEGCVFVYIYMYCLWKEIPENHLSIWESLSWLASIYGYSNWSLNRTCKLSKCAGSTEQSSVSTHGEDLDFTAILEDSNQHTVDAECEGAQCGSAVWKQKSGLLLYSMKITVQSGMITKNAIMGFHSVSRGQESYPLFF